MRPITGSSTTSFRIFLSSADDVFELRNMIDDVIRDGVDSALLNKNTTIRFDVDRWERTAPHKLLPGESGNAEFVARAKRAHLVLGILHEELRPGTKEELESVLDLDKVEVCVIWCVPRRQDWPDDEVGEWMLEHKGRLMIDRAGHPDTPGPVASAMRIVVEIICEALAGEVDDEELLSERR